MSAKVAWVVDLLYNTQRRRTCEQHNKRDYTRRRACCGFEVQQIRNKSK